MSIDFSAIVSGLEITAAGLRRPWEDLLLQSGYLSNGSDFDGFVPVVDSGAPQVPFGTAAKEHWRINKGLNDPQPHGPFLCTTVLSYFPGGGGIYDNVYAWGYNANAGGGHVVAPEPGLTWNMEADYHDGNAHKMEVYLQYTAPDDASPAVFFRPIFCQINRETHELTNLTLLSGRNASITLGKGYDDFATFGQLDEGILAIAGRTESTGHDTSQVILSTLGGKLRGIQFSTLTGAYGVDEVAHLRGLIAFDGTPSGTDSGDNFRLALYLDDGSGEDVITIARAAGSAVTFSRPVLPAELWLDRDPAAPFIAANLATHSLQIFNRRTAAGRFPVLEIDDAEPVKLVSPTSDGSGKSALVIDTDVPLSAADARLLTVKNAGFEKAHIDKEGSWIGGGATMTGIAASGRVLELKQDRASFNTAILFTDTGVAPGDAYSLVLSNGLEIARPGVSRVAHFGIDGIQFDSQLQLHGNVGFYGASPRPKPTVTGSREENGALASLLAALASIGLLTDGTHD